MEELQFLPNSLVVLVKYLRVLDLLIQELMPIKIKVIIIVQVQGLLLLLRHMR